jgi:phosphatidylserine decarboxylase
MVKDGYFYGVGCMAAAALLLWLTSWPLALIPVLLAAFFLWFFRNPSRIIPTGAGLIVSPGDGLVTETIRLETPQGPVQRISIFLSVFDVHVNRTPIAGTITSVRYQKGKYLNAMNPASADQNEQNIVTVRAVDGYEVTFKQIAGLLARRIVFDPQVGQVLGRGELVGLIKFGSRVDVVVPVEAELRVTKGVRVKGGASVLAAMPTTNSGARL